MSDLSDLNTFCRQVRSRTIEHRAAMLAIAAVDAPSQQVALLRQELDSMVRTIYLLTQADCSRRAELVRQANIGEVWRVRGGRRRISDREMVAVAQRLQGWTESVYRFGCAFIHLSQFHDHGARDPFRSLPAEEQAVVLGHMRHYHGGPHGSRPQFHDLIPYFPAVLEKITSNLEHYLSDLEAGAVIKEAAAV